ncbi:biotin--[acetyl-CoA-carboxylase] ligase [Arthrobacter sp. 35W]|uniref:biotin--[acetyl-CoA-carboxylase] ligase n=1 Tax=Arthrobacter sp. 35W TaxID=1132441 RepID=UPI00041539A4|nr:biotin--[acetyl-CoA-carboxylase] ligase [Arthrobacter sp. 35W]
MTSALPPLDASSLRAALLAPSGAYARVDVVPETGSTNADLMAAAANDDAGWPDLSVLLTDSQVGGRGRLDRSWTAPAGSSMISSVLLRPTNRGAALPMRAYGWFSVLAAIALVDALAAETGTQPALKWPNDVVLNGRKISGILAQLVPAQPGAASGAPTPPAVVVGIGTNVHQSRAQLPVDTATSLVLEGAATLDRHILLPAFLNRFAALYAQFCAVSGDASAPLPGGLSVRALATGRMATLGVGVRAELPGGQMLTGLAEGLDADGSLLIRDAAGTLHTVSAGDVVHLRRDASDGGSAYA